MLRTIFTQSRLNNDNLCGIDQAFCYPVDRPMMVAGYVKLPAYPNIEELYFMDQYQQTTIASFNTTDKINEYLSYVIVQDSNGQWVCAFRQMKPLFNYNGLQPEVTCYSMRLVFNTDDGPVTVFTEPVCYVEKYEMLHYTALAGVGDIPILVFHITTPAGNATYTYTNLTFGTFIDYTGPYVDIYLPSGYVLTSVTLLGNPIYFATGTQVFGAANCSSFVKLSGSGRFQFDCNGRYFGDSDGYYLSNMFRWTSEAGTNPNMQDPLRLRTDMLDVCIQNGKRRALDTKTAVARVRDSCFISHTQKVDRYKVYSTCPVPEWFQKEVDNVASMQQVVLLGTSPLYDDYDNYIYLMKSDEYQWKPLNYGEYYFPNLIFESCICFKDFSC